VAIIIPSIASNPPMGVVIEEGNYIFIILKVVLGTFFLICIGRLPGGGGVEENEEHSKFYQITNYHYTRSHPPNALTSSAPATIPTPALLMSLTLFASTSTSSPLSAPNTAILFAQ